MKRKKLTDCQKTEAIEPEVEQETMKDFVPRGEQTRDLTPKEEPTWRKKG